MSTAKLDTILGTPLFAGLSEAEAGALAERAIEKQYAPGEMLLYEGEPSRGLVVIGQGRVKIFKISSSGREVMLSIETAPSSVAEVPLFDGGPLPASVVAVDGVVAYLIDTRDFQHVLRQNPDVALKMLAVVGLRLRSLVSVVESVTFGSVRQRLARTLVEFGQQAGADEFTLPVTHQELALRLGTAREVVSRNLSRFQAEKLIRIEKRTIELVDRNGLEREAETEF
ncbi:MAG: Crp/Fnr family transcriptional regulator [Acidobacteria bacterium]|nr:Crp/Fnr family transcriptional regulator [Acidobacteriota bacterium]